MPLFGLINDSPIIYFGQRYARRVRRLNSPRQFRSAFGGFGRGSTRISLSFSGIVFRRPVLDKFLNSPSGPVGRYLYGRGLRVLIAARSQVGVKTGKLKASLEIEHSRRGPGQQVKVGSPLNYALVHHEGARPHIIVPRRAEALRFSARGRIVYTRIVRHPGTRPNKYLTDNLYLIR